MIPDAAVPPIVVGQTVALIVAVSVLWWRMANAENDAKELKADAEKDRESLWQHYEKLQEKLESLNGPRLDKLELEMMRSRDRLHNLEGLSFAIKHLLDVLDIKRKEN